MFKSRRNHQCGGIGKNFLTHTIHTHTHNLMCKQHYFSAHVHSLSAVGRFFAVALISRLRLTLLCSCHFTRNSVSVFISLRCIDDKIYWLGE